MFKNKYLSVYLLIAFAIETFCITYLQGIDDISVFVSVLYFICGIAIAAIVLFFPTAKKPSFNALQKPLNYLNIIFILIAGVLIYVFARSVIHENPMDYHNADMLPVIKKMNERFLHGDWRHVYDTIPEIWNGSRPIYLPAMWLPFSPAVILHIDLRWITVASFLFIVAASIMMISFKQKTSFIILAVLLVLSWWLLSENDTHGFFSFSEEGVVALYYFLLVIALVSENIFFIAVMTCLCLLSRYALIGWIPAFFLFLVLNKKRKQLITFSAVGILFFLFLFVIPFGWKAFTNLLQLPSQYLDFSKRVWQDSPEVFTDYIGFAKFFVPEKTLLLHRLLIILSFTVPVIFMFFCDYYKKTKRLSNIPLATLKIALVVFYNFIDVPYLYLFYTSSFVSLALVIIFTNNNVAENRQEMSG